MENVEEISRTLKNNQIRWLFDLFELTHIDFISSAGPEGQRAKKQQ